MEILLGEFFNLIRNHPVDPGDTISHKSMNNIAELGFAKRKGGKFVPTGSGLYLYNQLGCKTIKVKHKIDFLEAPKD